MCYSLRSSLISYFIGILSGLFAICTNQIALGVLILFFSQIQLSEAIIWRGIDTGNVNLNKIGTAFGKYTLPTHLFALGIGILLDKMRNKKKINRSDYIPMYLGVLFYIYVYIVYYRNKEYKTTTYPNEVGQLKWPYPTGWYVYGFIISFLTVLVYHKKIPYGVFSYCIFTLSLIWSIYYFGKYNVVPSIWCFIVTVISPIIVLLNFYLFPREYKLYKDF
jgi:hypothetical protein